MTVLFDSMAAAIGHTPLVRLRVPGAPGVEAYAKLELQNPFGMKDRVARTIIDKARRSGVLRAGAPIVESSSGSMALGVALVGTALDHPVHIVTDPRIDPITLAKLHSLGCVVHVVSAMTSHGWQSARLELVERLLRQLPGAFWPRQYSNPDNPAAYRGLAEEIIADLGHVDIVVGSVGSGGSLCGSSRALRRHLPRLSVVGVDCVGSALFGQPDRPERLQSGLGNSLLPANLDRRLIDEVHWLSDHEAFAAARDLAIEQQIFAGNTSGSVYRVMCQLAAEAGDGTRIVGILPDRGDRYAGTVYSDEYWERHHLTGSIATAPERVRYGTEVSTWSRAAATGAQHTVQHLLFVESNTTGTGMLALRRAPRLGLRPVLLTSRPDRYAELPSVDCDVVRCDTNSFVALCDTIRDQFPREEIAGITTTSEFYVLAVAELSDWLGLDGNPRAAVETCRNKASLRDRLKVAGVRQPRFAVLTPESSGTRVAAAVAEVGLPCVVKPTDDSGSTNVLLCHSVGEVAAQIARILAVRTNTRGQPTARTGLVEQYLEGPELSVEMFGWDDELHCLGVTDKTVAGAPWFVEIQHVFPSSQSDDVVAEVERVAREALEATGMRLGATHTEVRLTPDGPAVIEVNPRPAGGMIPLLIELASGVDLVEQHLRVAAGLAPQLSHTLGRHAGIRFLTATASGILAEVADVQRARAVGGVTDVVVTGVAGAVVRPPRDAYDRLGFVIAHGAKHLEVTEALEAAFGMLEVRVAAAKTCGH